MNHLRKYLANRFAEQLDKSNLLKLCINTAIAAHPQKFHVLDDEHHNNHSLKQLKEIFYKRTNINLNTKLLIFEQHYCQGVFVLRINTLKDLHTLAVFNSKYSNILLYSVFFKYEELNYYVFII